MTMQVPLSYVSYRPDNPAKDRWDQLWLQRMLNGEEGRPSGGYEFVEVPWTPRDGRGRVVVFPAGSYAEHNQQRNALEFLIHELYQIEWAVLFATSDECSTFPWHEYADCWPKHVQLWVQCPRPEKKYPPGTRFFGEGSPISAKQIAQYAQANWAKNIDVFFSGQMGHERRVEMWAALAPMRDRTDIKVAAFATEGFAAGMPVEEYLGYMAESWVAPCPSGPCTQDSFRFFEALEAQCFPIYDEFRPGTFLGKFWEMLGLQHCGFGVMKWESLPYWIDTALDGDRAGATARISAMWQQYKRATLRQIHEDVYRLMQVPHPIDADDQITVIVVTSPIPSNPSLEMIQETIASVRECLPRAEILVGCDGVHADRVDRGPNYYEFLRRLCAWTNSQDNITPFIAPEHAHESGLLRILLPQVETPFVLFVEHDCPLVNDIDFTECLYEMREHDLRHLRFSFVDAVPPEWGYLYLDDSRPRPGTRHIRTVQYSSRPALYTLDLMRELVETYFAPGSTAMIESVLYGAWQHAPDSDDQYPRGIRNPLAWKRYRSALWAPDPDHIAYSGHLDGRGDDPNLPIWVEYPDGEAPPGAPAPGVMHI